MATNNNKGKGFFQRIGLTGMYILIFGALALFWYYNNMEGGMEQNVSWSKFQEYVATGGVKEIKVITNKEMAEGVVSDSLTRVIFKDQLKNLPDGQKLPKGIIVCDIPSSSKFDDYSNEWRANGVFKGEVKYEKATDYGSIIWGLAPILLLIAFWFFIFRLPGRGGDGVFGVGKSRAKIYDKANGNKVTFEDVAGLSEAKTEIAEIVDFLRNPQTYTNLGGKIPKGALLVGPPGTGKTLLAKAVAGEADVPFFSLSGSDFVEMFVGVGASRVRDLFKNAKEKAPCIIFIDEIDAVGRARGNRGSIGGNDERESTLNQLLTEMDGFGTNSGIIVLAATNRAEILDPALLRAGRFDRQIYVELPDINDRKAIFKVHLRNVKIDESVDLDLLARQTPGFSGADIANVCNEAALIAARRKGEKVERQDFMDAVDRIVGGLEKKNKITTVEERRSIAAHEAGHATISWHLRYCAPLIKVTIVPRGKALGAAWYLPEERQITPKQALLDELCSLLGGRAAEELFTGQISTGAANDLERATKQAYAMVVYFGLSERLPNVCYYDSTGQGYGFTKPYSEERARIIDEEVSAIIAEQYERAKALLLEHAKGHNELTEVLLANEVILTEDVEKIFGKRQWTSRNDEILASAADEPDPNEPPALPTPPTFSAPTEESPKDPE